jgi:hypothetical protein
MRKLGRVFLWIVATILVLLVLVQLVASPVATHLANQRLAQMPQFTGHVESVRLQLWRGTISVKNLALNDRAEPGDGPVVVVPHGTLSLNWAPFFRGRIGGDLTFDHAQVVMVKRAETAKDEAEKAKKLSKPVGRAWQDVLAKQFPIEFRKIEAQHAQLRFDDRTEPQVVSLLIDDIDLKLEGFSNREKSREALPASAQMKGRVAGTGILTVDARADPADRQPRFEVKMEVKGLSLPDMHDFLVRYALIDVQSGEFDLYTEVNAAGGSYDGYTKPFFKNLKFEAVPDPKKTVLQRAATKVAAAFQNALKNERGDVATKAPFHGDFEQNKVEVWTTLENLLRNAFIQGLREGLEGRTGK